MNDTAYVGRHRRDPLGPCLEPYQRAHENPAYRPRHEGRESYASDAARAYSNILRRVAGGGR